MEQFHLQTKSSKIFPQAMVWLRNVILEEIKIGNSWAIEDHRTLSHFSRKLEEFFECVFNLFSFLSFFIQNSCLGRANYLLRQN